MPNPTRNDVHINAPLTNISVAHLQEANKFIATQVFPKVGVQKQSDLYFTYSQADFWRAEMKKRAPGTESAGAGFGLSTASYSCDVLALHKDIADQVRANADAPLNMDADTTKFLSQQFLIKRDADFAATYFKTGVWGTDTTPSVKWDHANGTPIRDIEKQLDAIELKTGYRGNTVVFGVDAFDAFKNSADVLDRIKYTQRGIVTEDMLAGILGVNKVLVARGIENTAIEGQAGSYSRLFTGDSALVCYAAAAPSLMAPSAGYTFTWDGYAGAGPDGQRMSRFRMDSLRSDRLEIEAAYDLKVVSADCGVFFSSVDT